MAEMYCVKCRVKKEVENVKNKTAKNGRNMVQGNCMDCNTKCSKFIKKE